MIGRAWLLEMERVWPVPPPDDQLPHLPPIRYVEIVIAIASVIGAGVIVMRRAGRTAPE